MQLKTKTLTLQQHAVLAGFPKQRDVQRALAARGFNVPQSVLSSMYRGAHAYPRAREALVRLFWPEAWAAKGKELERAEELLRVMISNSAPK